MRFVNETPSWYKIQRTLRSTEISNGALSYHLDILYNAGMVRVESQ